MSVLGGDLGGVAGGRSETSIAGASIFLGGVVAFMGIITAEVLYPGYSTRQDISDLGSTLPPNPVVHEPSSTLFNTTMMVTGLLLLVGVYFLHRAWSRRDLTVPFGVFALAVFFVGLFPGYRMPWHGLAAMAAFISGGLTLVLAARVVTRPFALLSAVLGVITLAVLASAIVLDSASPLLVMGRGGVERWVVYPILLWILGFGGYLLGGGEPA